MVTDIQFTHVRSNGKSGLYAVLFHYVTRAETAISIAETKSLIPYEPSSYRPPICDGKFISPRVNFTDVKPEEGRATVAANTGLNERYINYGLEVLVSVDRYKLKQNFPKFPRAYQIISREPLHVIAVKTWSMGEVERRVNQGHRIVRGIYPNGIPYSYCELTE